MLENNKPFIQRRIFQVKILNSLMQDKMAEFIKNTLNSDIPYVPWLTG